MSSLDVACQVMLDGLGRRGDTTLDRPQPIVRNRVRVKWACRVYERPSAASGRIDVLVEVKQVVRVVAPLQLDEPLVVHAEGLAHSVVVVGG